MSDLFVLYALSSGLRDEVVLRQQQEIRAFKQQITRMKTAMNQIKQLLSVEYLCTPRGEWTNTIGLSTTPHWLVVHPTSLALKKKKDLVFDIPFNVIESWGENAEIFQFKLLNDPLLIQFNTTSGLEINRRLLHVIALLMGNDGL